MKKICHSWRKKLRSEVSKTRMASKEIARCVGISGPTFSRYHSKGILPSKEIAGRIAMFFGKDPKEMIPSFDDLESRGRVKIKNKKVNKIPENLMTSRGFFDNEGDYILYGSKVKRRCFSWAKNLKREMKKSNISAAELSRWTGVSEATVLRARKYACVPSKMIVCKISKALGKDPKEMVPGYPHGVGGPAIKMEKVDIGQRPPKQRRKRHPLRNEFIFTESLLTATKKLLSSGVSCLQTSKALDVPYHQILSIKNARGMIFVSDDHSWPQRPRLVYCSDVKMKEKR